jgi:transposase-like protein
MAMNQVQFQQGLSMAQFIQRYGTDAKCYRALYRTRWPKGFRCPRCDSRPRSRFRRAGRVYYQCRACRHQTTLTSGTVFEGSKLPLTTWYLAMHLLTGRKTNMSVLELKRHLGVCYDTACKLKHKIMQVMTEREETRQLSGFVQIDDAYLGGERNGGKPGRGSENKQPFVVAVATDETLEHPNFAVIEPVRSFDNARSSTGANDVWRRAPRSSAMGWAASAVSSTWRMHIPCWRLGADVSRPRSRAHAG